MRVLVAMLSHEYGPATLLNPPKLKHVLPGIVPQESIGKGSPMGNYKVCSCYRVHGGTLNTVGIRWPDNSS